MFDQYKIFSPLNYYMTIFAEFH